MKDNYIFPIQIIGNELNKKIQSSLTTKYIIVS